MDERNFMKLALALARKGCGYVSPNPMVGAVVVKAGRIVGRGYHRAVGGPHAEVHALSDAGGAAEGADLYVTLEPCNHTGRTPPCTRRIFEAGIKRVFIAMKDPNPDVAGDGGRCLFENGLAVSYGLCEERARALNEVFIKHVTTKLPFVTVKCAATLDGRIATRSGDAKWVSSEASRAYVHELRHTSDGIMVGIGTVQKDDPSLTTRRTDGEKALAGVDPTRIILDTQLSIAEGAKVLRLKSESDTLVVIGPDAPANKRRRICAMGAKIIEAPVKEGLCDLGYVARRLGKLGIAGLLIEGGAKVIASALAAGIVDKVIFFFAPKILGGNDGVPVCRGKGPERMADAIGLGRITVKRFADDVMIAGYIDR